MNLVKEICRSCIEQASSQEGSLIPLTRYRAQILKAFDREWARGQVNCPRRIVPHKIRRGVPDECLMLTEQVICGAKNIGEVKKECYKPVFDESGECVNDTPVFEDDIGKYYPDPCPDCGNRIRLKPSQYGWFYSCESYPACEVTVGCHPGTTKPLGTPAGSELKLWRIRAHDSFDKLWKCSSKVMSRKCAYRWMQDAMGLTGEEAHIGKFDVEKCKQLIALVTAKLERNEKIGVSKPFRTVEWLQVNDDDE